jgi:hypothetical protein
MTQSSQLSIHGILPPAVVEHLRTQPECQLLWAVLQDAIETYMKYAPATNRRGQRLFHEVEDWIGQDDYTWLCSFVNICQILDLDPQYLRMGLVRWHARQRTTISPPKLRESLCRRAEGEFLLVAPLSPTIGN